MADPGRGHQVEHAVEQAVAGAQDRDQARPSCRRAAAPASAPAGSRSRSWSAAGRGDLVADQQRHLAHEAAELGDRASASSASGSACAGPADGRPRRDWACGRPLCSRRDAGLKERIAADNRGPGARGRGRASCGRGSRSAASPRPRRQRWPSVTAPTRWVWSGRCRAAPGSSTSRPRAGWRAACPLPSRASCSAPRPRPRISSTKRARSRRRCCRSSMRWLLTPTRCCGSELPALKIVQVVHVTGERTIDEALALATQVDALLLDSGVPDAPVRLLGGTGRVHDWSISRRSRRPRRFPCSWRAG